MWHDKQKLVLLKLAMAVAIASYQSTISISEIQAISNHQLPTSQSQKFIVFGAWAPSKFHLEKVRDVNQQINAISTLLAQGFGEYFFVMRDFNNVNETRATEQLLNSADKTNLKITIILLPPSEVDNYGPYPHVNYDWKGWIIYFRTDRRSSCA